MVKLQSVTEQVNNTMVYENVMTMGRLRKPTTFRIIRTLCKIASHCKKKTTYERDGRTTFSV